jgi:winged helix DNA-binding protein
MTVADPNLRVSRARLELTREQILAYRQRVGFLGGRLPAGSESLRLAAWAGLQDSMPRAALLSIHARVEGTRPGTWEDASLAQVWGPRYSAYVVPAHDVAVFTLGRLSDAPAGRTRAERLADRLEALLDGRRMSCGEAGHQLGVHPVSLRYAAPTGRLMMRWDGARQPTIWMVTAAEIDPREASLELARRFLHVFGAASIGAFAGWAGIRPAPGRATLEALAGELTPVRTPAGDGWILEEDEAAFRSSGDTFAPARLLPSGDTYFLLQGADRDLLVPDVERRRQLWTPRVWPGALLVRGEIAGTWRRNEAAIAIQTWRSLSAEERAAVESEAHSLPLPGGPQAITVTWSD